VTVAEALARGSQTCPVHQARAQQLAEIGWAIFDQSLALEMLTMGEDVREGMRAIREKRAPSFPSAR
jgi:enoyl-CoA hydratase